MFFNKISIKQVKSKMFTQSPSKYAWLARKKSLQVLKGMTIKIFTYITTTIIIAAHWKASKFCSPVSEQSWL